MPVLERTLEMVCASSITQHITYSAHIEKQKLGRWGTNFRTSSPLVAVSKARAFCFLVGLSLNPLRHDDTVTFLFLTWQCSLERSKSIPLNDEGGLALLYWVWLWMWKMNRYFSLELSNV